MASYLDMQTRIADELGNRTDLLSQIQKAIQTAIKRWSSKRFYFNEARNTSWFSTVALQEFYGSSTLAGIANLYHIDAMSVLVSGNRYEMVGRTPEYVEQVSINSDNTGMPYDYVYYNRQFRLYPIPDGAYPINVLGTFGTITLSADADENWWTNEAEELIRLTAKQDIYTNLLQQMDLAQAMKIQIFGDPAFPQDEGALQQLENETGRRYATNIVPPTAF